MRSFVALYKRELFAAFVTPLFWVLGTVFLLLQGMHFYLIVVEFAAQPEAMGDQTLLAAFFGNTVLLYVVLFLLVPAITMRLFAEERRSGAIELLVTAPITTPALVFAKYAAAVTTYVAMWLPTVLYLFILERAGGLDRGAAASAYLGVFLVGASYLAIGLLASALTKSQFIALVLTALAILALFLVGVGEFVTREGTLLHAACAHVSVWAQMNDFASGVVDSRRLVWDATLVVVPLLFTVRVIDAWKEGG